MANVILVEKTKTLMREYEFDLRDVGVFDGYAERNNLKKNSLKN